MANPFAALVASDVGNKTSQLSLQSTASATYVTEYIFGFTLNKNKQDEFFYLEDIADAFSSEELNFEIIEHALFERLLLTNSNFKSVKAQCFDDEDKKVILYLYRCFARNETNDDTNLKSQIKQLIIRNVVTAFKQPDLYEGQDLVAQMYEVLKTAVYEARDFFIQTFATFQNEEDEESFKEPLKLLLKILHVEIASTSLIMFPHYVFKILNLYATHKYLARIMLEYIQPKQPDVGNEYYNTLLGALFCVSALPKTAVGDYEFFLEGLNPVNVSRQEGIIWTASDSWNRDIHDLVLNLLKCDPEIRSQTLTWIGNCLKANEDRGKLWNSHAPHLNIPNTVSDGFMLNLGILLLKLCRPFCSNIKDGKILKLDPTFCAVPNEACSEKGIHLLDMSKETCLVPVSESTESRISADTYGFVTECFFMAHRAFEIGFKVLSDKLIQYNQEAARIERAYQDTMAGNMRVDDVLDTIKRRLEAELAKYLSTKCVMSEPNFLSDSFSFFSATAYWLNNVAMNVQQSATSTTFAPLKEYPIIFPLSENIPDTLKCIPEFVIENLVCYLIFLKRFSQRTFEEQGYDHLNPILTFILVYMGSSGYVRNPHLRAHLAEALEALLPFHKDEPSDVNNVNSVQRQCLFNNHEHRNEIVAILMDVFVSIEMTGQSVQFEQKFNYRRPMYMVMHYLWEMDEYKLYFRKLAEEAELNMEAVSPPIFLRFVNLLINDAIFLLDESLTNMAKLRELETKQENGEWNNLSIQERAQNFGYLRHTAMMAKFDNILGRDTIRTLEYLTSAITIVFTHSTMVDRVAAMLNYFLLKLVGPDKKNFKVKDQKEYSFNPAATVLDICKIYVNLKESSSFCLAVSQDGRSYSPKLFTLAEVVLVRIGGGQLVGELQDVGKKVAEKAAEYKSNEEAAADAPDNYLDPIMSTLMLDPVILPSSKQIVDRSTIARHLLSDQTDPFNRAPLSMDQVIPHSELAVEIRKWLDEKRNRVK